jgi:hypothetical protein
MCRVRPLFERLVGCDQPDPPGTSPDWFFGVQIDTTQMTEKPLYIRYFRTNRFHYSGQQ